MSAYPFWLLTESVEPSYCEQWLLISLYVNAILALVLIGVLLVVMRDRS